MLNSTVMILAMTLGQTDMTSTAEEFQEFGDLTVGRWSGEITLINDWPGLSKKAGEKLIVYVTRQWVVDKKGILETEVGGETTAIRLWGYDPAAKRIFVRSVGSAGGSFELTVWRENARKWAWKVASGALVDGKKTGGTGHWLFSDDGKSVTLQGNITVDGKPTPLPLNDTYTRLD